MASNQLSVAFVLPSLAHGGAQRVFLDLVNYLSLQGFKLTLVVLDRDGELLSELTSNISVVYLDQGIERSCMKRIRQLFRLRHFIKRNNVSAIFSTITGMNILTLLATVGLTGVRVVIREASSLENISSRFQYTLAKFMYPRADSVICTSSYVRVQLETEFRIAANKTLELPNPLDIERIRSSACKGLSREDIELVSKGPLILAVGRLIPAKGFDVLILAMKRVVLERPDVYLGIVGDGPERSALMRLIKDNSLENHISLLGYRSNPYPLIKACNLFVLSSRWEGYVNVLMEAMAFQKPIVATDCKSGPGKLLQECKGQTLVEVEDAGALSSAIIVRLGGQSCVEYDQILSKHSLPEVAREYWSLVDDR